MGSTVKNFSKFLREHDGFVWLAVILAIGGYKLYPTFQERFLNPCESVYEEVRIAESRLQASLMKRNQAVSEFFELENSNKELFGNPRIGVLFSRMLESDDPVFEKRDVVYQLVTMEPKCFSRLDVITSKKEIENYSRYLARESTDKSRPIYLPGFLKESDYPQWGFKSVIPDGK